MLRVLHISGEYRCVRNPDTTVAIRELVENGNGDPDYIVFSLKRTWNPFQTRIEWLSPGKVAHFQYWGLPMGLLLAFSCKLAAGRIHRELLWRDISFDLVHAHKLTIEGLIAERLTKLTNRNYVVSVRGKTDAKILRWKPFLRRRFRQILRQASHVFFVSAWAPCVVEELLGERSWKKHSLLPNGLSDAWVENNGSANARANPCEHVRLVAVFRLDLYRSKGLPTVLRALAEVKSSCDWILDVYGGGSQKTRMEIEKAVAKLGLQRRVFLRGAIENNQLRECLRNYDAFVMPSHAETFGIAYVEALASGLPILYSSGRGIDGYFSGKSIGLAVDPSRKKNIVEALLELIEKNQEWKTRVVQYIEGGGLERFRRRTIVDHYINELRSIR